MTRWHDAAETIRALAADAGVHARVHARAVETTTREAEAPEASTPVAGRRDVEALEPEVAVEADTPTAIASLYKPALAGAWADLVAAGEFDPVSRLRLPSRGRAPGETGVAALADDVEVSQRDAVRLMLAVSDNACAEALLDLVGLTRVAAWLAGHGLSATAVRRGSAQSLRRIIEETGGRSLSEAMSRLADPRHDRGTSEYDSAMTSSGTARELTAILRILWLGEQYDWVRESMRRQAWRHRIGSGFPHDDVGVAGKTGTLGRLRHEAAVVHFPHELPVAVAVMTVSVRPEMHQPRVDAAIGAIARTAVNALRTPAALAMWPPPHDPGSPREPPC